MADPIVNYRITAIDETKKAIAGIKDNFSSLKTVIAGIGAAVSVGALSSFIGDTISDHDDFTRYLDNLPATTGGTRRRVTAAAVPAA